MNLRKGVVGLMVAGLSVAGLAVTAPAANADSCRVGGVLVCGGVKNSEFSERNVSYSLDWPPSTAGSLRPGQQLGGGRDSSGIDVDGFYVDSNCEAYVTNWGILDGNYGPGWYKINSTEFPTVQVYNCG